MSDSTVIRRSSSGTERGIGLIQLLRSLVRNRSLVWELARREMTGMHAGQMAGVIWLAVHPLALFAVYTFLFSVVFQVRIGERGPSDYLIYLFSGLAPWLLTQDILIRSATAMTGNTAIVKKVMFPPEILVAKTILSSLAVQALLLVTVIIYIIAVRGGISWSFVLLPALFGMHLMLLLGLGLLLAAWTPYFRDITEFIRIFATVNIYLMPVVYAPSMVPDTLRFVLGLNPFSYLIWCYQDVLYFGSVQHPFAWIFLFFFSTGALVAGSYVFVRLRHHFNNVL
jgi:lipopolysaccharide transport system permease protein